MDTNLLTNKITELQRRLDSLENTNQPYVGDWIPFNPANFSGTGTDSEILLEDKDPRNIMTGDRIKYLPPEPSTEYEYGFVAGISVDAIYLMVKNSNTVYREFYVSKLPNPKNFEAYFLADYPLTFSTSGLTDGSSELAFYMIGSRVFNTMLLDVSLSGVGSTITLEVPYASDAYEGGIIAYDALGGYETYIRSTTNNVVPIIIEIDQTTSALYAYFTITRTDGANFGTQNFSTYINWQTGVLNLLE